MEVFKFLRSIFIFWSLLLFLFFFTSLFEKIEGDENTIMGLPVKRIKEYISTL